MLIWFIAGSFSQANTHIEMLNAYGDTDFPPLQPNRFVDRRVSARFPLQLDLRYQRAQKSAPWIAGRTVNISSSGLLFEANSEPAPGGRVRLSVAWPVALDQKAALRLIILGRVVRVFGGQVAVAIHRFEFRTTGVGAGTG